MFDGGEHAQQKAENTRAHTVELWKCAGTVQGKDNALEDRYSMVVTGQGQLSKGQAGIQYPFTLSHPPAFLKKTLQIPNLAS